MRIRTHLASHRDRQDASDGVRSHLLQRKCACAASPGIDGECAKCRGAKLQRNGGGKRPTRSMVPPIVHEVLLSPGLPLDPATRAFMEPRFNHDFGRVRVHIDSRAAESARAVDALAYTLGPNIVFGAGQYGLGSIEGKRLLAHELTHVVQQDRLGQHPDTDLVVASAGGSGESEADEAARRVSLGDHAPSITTRDADGLVQRDTAPSPSPTPAPPSSPMPTSIPSVPAPPAPSQEEFEPGNTPGCTPSAGKPPSAPNCVAYTLNAWWLPDAYLVNATCACLATPNSPSANCVRQFLQDRLAATPIWLKAIAASQKALSGASPASRLGYEVFVQTVLTPRIYADHVDAYRSCCCPSGPAPYPAWVGVTTVPLPVCDLVGLTIRWFGSCHGTPGAW